MEELDHTNFQETFSLADNSSIVDPEIATGISTEIMAEIPPEVLAGVPKIKVVGVGGGGCNAVTRMFKDKLGVVEYYGINTDAQHLYRCDVTYRIPIGKTLTRGLGAGAQPELGRQAAEESRQEIKDALEGADMVFLAAGMGGGTGSGGAPVVAQIAKECGALTVAVVCRPFSFESASRRKNADEAIARLKDHADTVIVIPNDRLLQLNTKSDQTFTWEDALKMADSVLHQGIAAIAEVVTVPGEINVDFADVKTILTNAGAAWLAIGRGKGEHRAADAARMATKSPLLDIAMDGAKRILFVITGGPTLTLEEIQQAASIVHELADPESNIIFGTSRDPNLDDEVRITMIAAAFPVIQESTMAREADLQKLLQDVIPEEEQDLDVPSFLRRQSVTRNRGFFR
jgi:cell division protein FtsZ